MLCAISHVACDASNIPHPGCATIEGRALDHSPEGLDEVEVGELVAVHKGLEDLQIDGVPGEGAEGREGCTGELAGTYLLEGIEVGEEQEGTDVLLLDPVTIWPAHNYLTPQQIPPMCTACLPHMSTPPSRLTSTALTQDRNLAWEGLPLSQILPLSLPAW